MNPYETLGVARECSQDDIKKAYRKLSMKYHPDKNLGDESATSKFQEITRAYGEIGTAEKRGQFNARGRPPGQSMPMNMNEAEFMDFMRHTMNSMGGFRDHPQSQSPLFKSLQKPQPIVKKIAISLELAFQGGSVPLSIERRQLIGGERSTETESIYVDIPQGVDDNELLVVREKGNVIDGTRGDVKIFVKIENTTGFRRSGLDMIYEKTVTLREALCGFTFEIKYINGRSLKMHNNAGSVIRPGFKKMVEGLGFKRGSHTGNLIVIFSVEFPQSLTAEQITTLAETL